MTDRATRLRRSYLVAQPPPLPAQPPGAPLQFDDPRMTITPITPHLWVGAMAKSGSDFTAFGGGTRVYIMRDEVLVSPTYRGAEVTHAPLVDNVTDAVTDPPTVRGVSLARLREIAREVHDRVFVAKLPTVVCCAWGYNRSACVAAWAMVLGGYAPDVAVDMINVARGPHPMGYGVVLNNPSLRALVMRAGGRR